MGQRGVARTVNEVLFIPLRSEERYLKATSSTICLEHKFVALTAEMFQAIEQRRLQRTDRHLSPQVMVRHVAKLSGTEAATGAQIAAMMRDLPQMQVICRGRSKAASDLRWAQASTTSFGTTSTPRRSPTSCTTWCGRPTRTKRCFGVSKGPKPHLSIEPPPCAEPSMRFHSTPSRWRPSPLNSVF